MSVSLVRTGLWLALLVAEGAAASAQQAQVSADPTYSGYANDSRSLEGGHSVTDDLALDDADIGAVLACPKIEGFFQPFFDWMQRLNAQTGLQLQFS